MKFFCEYCGYHIDSDKDQKCPNCGAAYNRNKTYLRLEKESKENKERNTKQVKKIGVFALSLFILIPILFIGAFAIIALKSVDEFDKTSRNGFDLINGVTEQNIKTKEQIQSEIDVLQTEINNLNTSIANTQIEIDSINKDLASLKTQLDIEFHTNQFSERYYTLSNEITKLQKSVWDKESEISNKNSQFEDKQEEIAELEKELKNGN